MVADRPPTLFEEDRGEGPGPEAGPTPRGPGAAAPLAERLRPRTLEEFVGQRHLLAEGRLLRALMNGGSLPSLILWGPPGSGKTTLARLLAAAHGAEYVALSAIHAGVGDIRQVAATARRLRRSGRRTVLFVDEIHRFSKAQQDAFLPYLEHGALTLIGATTENPSFELVGPLLSRCKVVCLEPLSRQELLQVLGRALETAAPRGLGQIGVRIGPGELEAIARFADGDARVALNTLELAVELARGPAGGPINVTEAVVRRAMHRRVLRHDKAGEEHYGLISALQKSIRNSDPDAALYWLARLLEAGEDPLYVGRRLLRTAAEDVGLADPQALGVALAGFQTVQVVGLPEGALALAEAAVYLATAPKSNALDRGYGAAAREVREGENPPVPLHLRNPSTRLTRELGYGRGYRYAHDLPGGVAPMACLPEPLQGRRYYRPTARGYEATIAERLREWQRARQAADTGGRHRRRRDEGQS